MRYGVSRTATLNYRGVRSNWFGALGYRKTEYHGRLPSNVIVNFVGLKINLKLLWEQLSSKPKA